MDRSYTVLGKWDKWKSELFIWLVVHGKCVGQDNAGDECGVSTNTCDLMSDNGALLSNFSNEAFEIFAEI